MGEVTAQETSILVTRLRPAHYYTLRVVAVSPSNFHAASAPIRLRTKPALSEDYFDHPLQPDEREASASGAHQPQPPSIIPYKAFLEASVAPLNPVSMAREHSNSQSHGKRSVATRRQSPASLDAEENLDPLDSGQNEGSIQHLTAKLEALRRETEDVERQIAEEEEEFQNARSSLLQQRDDLKEKLKEREDASRELKKQVASSERMNTAAQAKRAAQEKVLQQKQSERQKIKDDMDLWEREMGQLRAEVQRMQREKSAYQETSKAKLTDMRSRHADEQQANKTLEEAIRERGIQIKELEDRRKMEEDERETGGRGYDDISERWKKTSGKHAASFRMLSVRLRRLLGLTATPSSPGGEKTCG